MKILHIMGETSGRGILEIIIVEPEEGIPPEDYVMPGDDIQEAQTIELEGGWPSMPVGRAFEFRSE